MRHAYVPPRIQWVEFLSATMPMPCSFASSAALSAQKTAFVIPIPR